MYKLENIIKKYGEVKIFQNFNLEIKKGQLISFFGKSGVGKTTLISIIGMLDNKYSGNYFFNNILINKLNDDELSLLRKNKIGFIFQENYLINDIKVIDNLLLNFENKYDRKLLFKIEKLAKKFEIFEVLKKRTSTLSSGEKQRVTLLRALINDPELIIADEPTGNLDEKNSNLILAYLKELTITGKTVIIVSHDDLVMKYSDICYFMFKKGDKSDVEIYKK